MHSHALKITHPSHRLFTQKLHRGILKKAGASDTEVTTTQAHCFLRACHNICFDQADLMLVVPGSTLDLILVREPV